MYFGGSCGWEAWRWIHNTELVDFCVAVHLVACKIYPKWMDQLAKPNCLICHSVATLRLCPALPPIASHKLVEPAALQRQWDGWMQTCSVCGCVGGGVGGGGGGKCYSFFFTTIHTNPHVLRWIGVEFELNSTPIHTNTYGLKWIRQHPNKAWLLNTPEYLPHRYDLWYVPPLSVL